MITAAREGVKTRQVAYKLPPSLIKRIRREAAERGVYPAQVVAERLDESYQIRPPLPQSA